MYLDKFSSYTSISLQMNSKYSNDTQKCLHELLAKLTKNQYSMAHLYNSSLQPFKCKLWYDIQVSLILRIYIETI